MANKERKISIIKKRIYELLQEKDLTIKELSLKTGIPYNTIRQDIGKEKIMKDEIIAISEFLDISPLYLTGEEKEPLSYETYTLKPFFDNKGIDNIMFNVWLYSEILNNKIDTLNISEININKLEKKVIVFINEEIEKELREKKGNAKNGNNNKKKK